VAAELGNTEQVVLLMVFTERLAASRPELATRIRLIGRLYASLRYGRLQRQEAVRWLQRLVRGLKI